ncbi:MAG: DUF6505 family protein [Geminicoccaceae bacterium]
MRFLRTIRFDASDERVFERAAEPEEWAVSGAFAFADIDPDTLRGKQRQAFRSGFLGTQSFGWSTFVAVAEIPPDQLDAVVLRLARHFVEHYGAPSPEAALPAARAEAEFTAGICEHPINTLIAVERRAGPDGIVERFRTVQRTGEASHAKIWTIVDDQEA